MIGICFLISCLGLSKGRGPASLSIPNVEIDCAPGASSFCTGSKDGSKVYVGLSTNSDPDYNCKGTLQEGDFVDLASYFDARAVGTMEHVGGGLLQAQLSEWEDKGGYPITNLPNFAYVVCAFIDTENNNERFDPDFEPYAQVHLDTLPNVINIHSWFDI